MNNEEKEHLQKLKLLSLQEVLQAQEQSNKLMLQTISDLEVYYLRICHYYGFTPYNYRPKYRFYDIGNSLHYRKLETLQKQAQASLYLFQDDYSDFKKKFNGYLFPQGLGQEEIKKDIKIWIYGIEYIQNKLNKSNKIIFDENCFNVFYDALDIFEEKSNPEILYKNLLENLEHKGATEQMVKNLINATCSVTRSNAKIERNIKEALEKNIKYNVVPKTYRSVNENVEYAWIRQNNASFKKDYYPKNI